LTRDLTNQITRRRNGIGAIAAATNLYNPDTWSGGVAISGDANMAF